MKIILYLALACFVAAQKFNMDKYKQQFKELCTSDTKNVCTKENIEFGKQYYQNRVKELQEDAIRKQKQLKKAEKTRRIQQINNVRMQQLLRQHFLDRHL